MEVILQRNGRRQMFHAADFGARQRHVVLLGIGKNQFDRDVRREKITEVDFGEYLVVDGIASAGTRRPGMASDWFFGSIFNARTRNIQLSEPAASAVAGTATALAIKTAAKALRIAILRR